MCCDSGGLCLGRFGKIFQGHVLFVSVVKCAEVVGTVHSSSLHVGGLCGGMLSFLMLVI